MSARCSARARTPRFVQVSTDEVYGTLGPEDAPFTEITPLAPNSPYAASKAAADLLVRAAHHTHGMATVITRCSNNYGPYQFPEKLIPLFVTNAFADIPLPVYGDGKQVPTGFTCLTTAEVSMPHFGREKRVGSTISAVGASGTTWKSPSSCSNLPVSRNR